MVQLTLALDALALLREEASAADVDLSAAAMLADLAGIDAVRVGLREEMRPVGEADLQQLRRAAPSLEIRMAPSQSLLKPVLEAQPDRVVICGDSWECPAGARPLDPRTREGNIAPIVRALADGGVPSVVLIPPDMDAVKAARSLGVGGVELYTGFLVDLPPTEREAPLEALADAVKLATKIKLEVALAGGLGQRTAASLCRANPAATRVVAGRSLIARAALVGIDRAVRDFRAFLQ